jgi:ATP-binding cassette subfamily C protein CydD
MMSLDRRVLRLDERAPALLYGAVTLAALASVLLITLAWLLSDTIYRIFLGGQNRSTVLLLFLLMLTLTILRSVFLGVSEMTSSRAAGRVKEAARTRLTEKLHALGPARLQRERSGELVHTVVEGIETLDEYVREYQVARLLAGLVPALIFVVVLALDPWSALVLLFAGPMLVLMLALIGARTQDLSRRRSVELGWMSSHFLDMVQGLATLKLYGRSKDQVEVVEDISRQLSIRTMQVLRTALQTSLVLEWASVAATAFVALEVSLRLMRGLLPFNIALTVLLLTPDFFFPMRQLALKYHAGTAGKAAAERIFDLLDRSIEPAPHPSDQTKTSTTSSPMTPPPRRFDVSLEDVCVTYDGRSTPALAGVTLTLPSGRTTALVGPSGAGKSTLAALLLRFIEPSAGSIRLGNVPLAELDPTICRSLIAWVPQHPHIFHGTISENILLARPDAGPDAVIAAARAAHADEFIEALPDGYQTPINEGGTRLSGGQRQRIAIARAFLKDAPMLILDEATAHLDAETELAIRDSILQLKRGRTILIIAHRLEMVYDADQIAVMDQGAIVETGTHSALLSSTSPSLYRTLVSQYRERAFGMRPGKGWRP